MREYVSQGVSSYEGSLVTIMFCRKITSHHNGHHNGPREALPSPTYSMRAHVPVACVYM